jgi:transposase-like protein
MLSAKRDVCAAKRFFKKLMRAEHRRLPFTIGTDKHASYPEAFAVSVKERVLPPDCKLRRVKYPNNIIEQDHRFIKKKVRASQCFKSFHTAERTLEGIESINMIRKGQVKRLAGSDARGQATFVAFSVRDHRLAKGTRSTSAPENNVCNATDIWIKRLAPHLGVSKK